MLHMIYENLFKMKKLLILLAFLNLSVVGFSQIEIEIFHPVDGYKSLVNDTATVCLELSSDSTKLLIQDSVNKVVYDVDKVIVTEASSDSDTPFLITEITILNDPRGIYRITMWEGMNLVLFEYKNEMNVLNSGKGITYYF